jgi:5'-nucleotidase
MDRRFFVKSIVAGGTGLVLGGLPRELFASGKSTVITFLHTNDIHCHIEPFAGTDQRTAGRGGLARISEFAAQVRDENPNTYLFDAGDMYQGTPYFNYYKGELILKLMTEAGYEAGTIGNHEFDNGLEGIRDYLKFAGFPLINSNYDFSETILKGAFKPYKIFKKGGVKVGVYGLGVKLEGLVAEKNYGKTVFNNPLTVALEMEKFLAVDSGCDLVVCLSHLGLRNGPGEVDDVDLASSTHHTNLVIGGHSHSFLEKPMEVKNADGKIVIVNQAWWGGLMVGRVDFVMAKGKSENPEVYAQNVNM